MHDVERRRRRRRNLRAQTEVLMLASSNHFTILFLAKILRTKTRNDFQFLNCKYALKLIDNILIVTEFRPI